MILGQWAITFIKKVILPAQDIQTWSIEFLLHPRIQGHNYQYKFTEELCLLNTDIHKMSMKGILHAIEQ